MLAPCSNVLLLSIILKETTEILAIFSLNRQIKERKIMSPPALSTQIIAGLRRIAVESFPENPAEAVSHPEQCPRYSHAPKTASEAQETGREGAEHPGCLSHILTCSSSSRGQQASLHSVSKCCPSHLCWVLSGVWITCLF